MLFHWLADKIIILQTKRKATKLPHRWETSDTPVIQPSRIRRHRDISRCFLTHLFGEIVLSLHKNPIRWPPLLLARALCWLSSTFSVFDTQNAVGHTHNNGLVVRLVRIMTNSHGTLALRNPLSVPSQLSIIMCWRLWNPQSWFFFNYSAIAFAVLG